MLFNVRVLLIIYIDCLMYNYLCELGGVCYNVLYNVVYKHCTREYVCNVIISYRRGSNTEKSFVDN